MKKRHIITLLAILANQAWANDFYIGASYLNFVIDDTTAPPTANSDSPEAYTVTAGLNLHPNYTWEARFGFGQKEAENTTTAQNSLSIDRTLGLYNKLSPNFENGLDPFITLGITAIDRTLNPPNTALQDSARKIDFSYGAGLDVHVSEAITMGIEYLRLYRRENITIDSAALSLSVGF